MKKSLLVMAFFAGTLTMGAQQLKDGYIQWPSSSQLHNYINIWKNNNYKVTSVGNGTWEDENFFISRVAPRAPFRNAATQVYDKFTEANDKRLCWWVPIGNCRDGEFHTNALPNGVLDSEVFSMWSYVTHYGDWTSPYGWVPGGFADVAHKNGCAVSGVASIPFGSLGGDWQTCMQNMGSLNGTDVANFLYYHGCDGLGYNSEFTTGSSIVSGLRNMHESVAARMSVIGQPLHENIWYGGTTDSGGCSFDIGLSSSTQLYKAASIFLNYNYPSTLGGVVSAARNIRDVNGAVRSPLFAYAGNDMQGGQPKSGTNWATLCQYNVSIGLWGAHNYNMFWQARNGSGSAPATMQRTYLNMCEQWFTNGPRNPAVRIAPFNKTQHVPDDRFCGMSSMMTARSAIKWNIADEPFISYFNLGNGAFFNWMGERLMTTEWYNIGVQDYLPTWRFWFSKSFLNGDQQASQLGLNAEFTWDDAYFGGSCLKITGNSNGTEYLHLFKTQLAIASGHTVTVRYKILGGTATDIKLVSSNLGSETTEREIGSIISKTAGATNLEGIIAASHGGWQEATLPISAMLARNLKTMTNITLKFEGAQNLELYLGEISIKAKTNTATPSSPIISMSKILAFNHNGIDGKIIWEMPGKKAAPTPTYNSDVNVSMFRLWSCEEDGKPHFVGATTSWAGLIFKAPVGTDNNKRIRFGVSAVSMDMNTESPISWGAYINKPSYTTVEDVELSKKVLKANEPFQIYFADPQHASATWALYNQSGSQVASGSGRVFDLTAGLPTVGAYDLVINGSRRLNNFVLVSEDRIGAYPELSAIHFNGADVTGDAIVNVLDTDNVTVGYTGRSADGKASRGISMNDNYIGVPNSYLQFGSGQKLTFMLWVKFDEFPSLAWDFINVWDRSGSWPQSNWGWMWSGGEPDGRLSRITFRGAATDGGSPGELQYTFPNTYLQAGVWSHIAMVVDRNGNAFRMQLYVNGKLQENTWRQLSTGNSGSVRQSGSTNDWVNSATYAMAQKDVICFGGPKYQGAACNGIVDDLMIWDRALTAAEINQYMNGFAEGATIPSGLLGYWDFEKDPTFETLSITYTGKTETLESPYVFMSRGTSKTIPTFNYRYLGGTSEGQGFITPMPPAFTAGSPFVHGESYQVKTTPSWKDSDYRTKITGTGTDRSGSATVQFASPEGSRAASQDHNMSVTLTNAYASHTLDYPVYRVTASVDAIGADKAGEVKAYTVADGLFVEFAEDGNYTVAVYNMAGVQLAERAKTAVAGQNVFVSVGASGVYVVNVLKDGHKVATLKVVKN